MATPCYVPGLTQIHWQHYAIYQDLLNSTGYTMLYTRTYSIRWLHILCTRTYSIHWLHMLCTRTLYSIRWLHILSTRTSLIPLATPCYVPGLIILQAILFTTGYIKYHSSDPITVEMYVSRLLNMMYQIKLKRFYKH